MRVAYIVNSLEAGGAQFPIPDIIAVLRARGAQVCVFALSRKDGLTIPHLERHAIPYRVRDGGQTDHLAALRWLMREMKVFRPDLMWTSLARATFWGQIAATRLKVPTVHWIHTALISRGNAFLLRRCRKRASLWVADSPTVQVAARRILGLGDTLMCWPIFQVQEGKIQRRPAQQKPFVSIGTIGRLNPVKGLDVLCEAVRRLSLMPDLPEFRVFIAGDGPERAALERTIAAHRLPIELLGFCDKPFAFLAGLDIYVQPSHREGMCIAAHEAMSCGLPLIATAAGQLPFTVEDGHSGIIIPFNDPAALAAAMARLIVSPARTAAMGAAAALRVRALFSSAAFESSGNAILDRLPGFSAPTGDASVS